MVHLIRFLSAAALASLSAAAPLARRDSAIGVEVAVSAPDGIVLSDTPTGTYGGYQTPPPMKDDNKYSPPPMKGDNKYPPPPDNKYPPPSDNMYPPPDNKYPPPPENKYPPPMEENKYPPPPMEDSSTMMMESSTTSMMMDESSTSSMMMEESSTSSMMMEESSTSSYMMDTTSSYMTDTTSTMMMESSSTDTASMSYSTPPYGSGGESWGGNGYNDCVMQCAASYGMASATWTPPTATQDSKASGDAGSNGVTHTIIVAPTKGVFRYVPFATNASVGDTVTFKWGAGPHTVTQSSALEVCNKTDLSTAFPPSGQQDAGFTYDIVVKDTKPVWFYCGVPGHCEKGMFGGINIGQPNPEGQSTPLGSVVVNMTESSSDMKAMYGYTKQQTKDNAYANNWGMGINVAGMDQNAMMETMKNVLWTQSMIAANPGAVDKDKGFQVTDKPLTIPADIGVALAASSPAPANAAAGADSSSTTSSASSSTSSSGASPSSTTKSNAAVSVTSSSVAFGFVAIVATFLML